MSIDFEGDGIKDISVSRCRRSRHAQGLIREECDKASRMQSFGGNGVYQGPKTLRIPLSCKSPCGKMFCSEGPYPKACKEG